MTVAPTIVMTQPPYPLTEAELLRLDHGPRAASTWSMNILLTGVGAVISAVAPGIFDWVQGKALKVDRAQFSIAIGTIVLSGAVWFVLKLIPGDQEKTMRKVRKHFKDNPPKQQIGVPR